MHKLKPQLFAAPYSSALHYYYDETNCLKTMIVFAHCDAQSDAWYLDAHLLENNNTWQSKYRVRIADAREVMTCVLEPGEYFLHILCCSMVTMPFTEHKMLLEAMVVTCNYQTGATVNIQRIDTHHECANHMGQGCKHIYFEAPRNQLLFTHVLDENGKDCSTVYDFNSGKWNTLRDDPLNGVWLRTNDQHVIAKDANTLISLASEKVNEFDMFTRTWHSYIPNKKKLKKNYVQLDLNRYYFESMSMRGHNALVLVLHNQVLTFDFALVRWKQVPLQHHLLYGMCKVHGSIVALDCVCLLDKNTIIHWQNDENEQFVVPIHKCHDFYFSNAYRDVQLFCL